MISMPSSSTFAVNAPPEDEGPQSTLQVYTWEGFQLVKLDPGFFLASLRDPPETDERRIVRRTPELLDVHTERVLPEGSRRWIPHPEEHVRSVVGAFGESARRSATGRTRCRREVPRSGGSHGCPLTLQPWAVNVPPSRSVARVDPSVRSSNTTRVSPGPGCVPSIANCATWE